MAVVVFFVGRGVRGANVRPRQSTESPAAAAAAAGGRPCGRSLRRGSVGGHTAAQGRTGPGTSGGGTLTPERGRIVSVTDTAGLAH